MSKRTLVTIANEHAIEHDGARMRLVRLDDAGGVTASSSWQGADLRQIARWIKATGPSTKQAKGFKRLT